MFDSEYIKVFAGSIIEVEHLKQSLEAAGIEPILKDTNLGINATLATDYQALKEMYVHKSEVEKAKVLIQEAFPETN